MIAQNSPSKREGWSEVSESESKVRAIGHEFSANAFNAGFPDFGVGVIIGLGKDPIMDLSNEFDEKEEGLPASIAERPSASDWLWHPWYAKLWWAGIVVYWTGKTGSLYSSVIDEFYTSAPAGFLNIAFFPPLALIVLGLGFARAWFEWSDWEFVEPTHEQMFPKRSVGGMRDPCADPLDPRSGPLHWRYLEDGK